jgi:oligoribonuclease (3'-5' exoribonuclease)
MDEGVDPTHMCQSLVEKVAQSEQLRAVTEPDILPLFEDWLDELESEIRERVMASSSADDPLQLARDLGLSDNGASFMIAKLRREGKIS